MGLSLNHVSIRTADLEACRRFYVEVLGLRVGPRPDFPFPGLWLYGGDDPATGQPVVHVIGVDRNDSSGRDGYLGERPAQPLRGSGALDHVAFAATGLSEMRIRLARLGLAIHERTVPGLGLRQLFLTDPDGIVVELNYPGSEA